MNGIMKYVNRIHRMSGMVYSSKLKNYGIAQCQHPYILMICREPGISQEKLAKEICVNKSNVTRQLAVLEEKGLITRKQDEQDRRIWRAYPTQTMQELLPCVRKVMQEWNEYILAPLSGQERQTLIALLEKVGERANEAAQKTLSGREKQE